MTETATPPESLLPPQQFPKIWKRLAGLAASAAMATGCAYATDRPYDISTTLVTATESFPTRCPDQSAVLQVAVPGMGMNTTAVLGLSNLQQISEVVVDRSRFVVCNAAVNPGDRYRPQEAAEKMYELIKANGIEMVNMVALSMGDMYAFDTIRHLRTQHPDAKTKFAVTLIASPVDQDSINFWQQVMTKVMAFSPTGSNDTTSPVGVVERFGKKATIFATTVAGVFSQLHNDRPPGQKWEDSVVNTKATPVTLVTEQATRIEAGLQPADVPEDVLVSVIIDPKDEVINVPAVIEQYKKLFGDGLKIYFIEHDTSTITFGYHAAMWTKEQGWVYTGPMRELLTSAIARSAIPPSFVVPTVAPMKPR